MDQTGKKSCFYKFRKKPIRAFMYMHIRNKLLCGAKKGKKKGGCSVIRACSLIRSNTVHSCVTLTFLNFNI